MSESELGSSQSIVPQYAPALDGADSASSRRSVTVHLVADHNSGYAPGYSDRVLIVEPVHTQVIRQAKAEMIVQGIDTVLIGESCENLRGKYPALTVCELSETVAVSYGPVEATATTDSEGFATFDLGGGAYRVSMQSWPTLEDARCNWSGSSRIPAQALLPAQWTSLELKVLVYCE